MILKPKDADKTAPPQELPQRKKIAAAAKIEIIGQSSKTKIPINIAKCCLPKPGDNVIGYVTVARGISVHKTDCRNLARLKNTDKFVGVGWR